MSGIDFDAAVLWMGLAIVLFIIFRKRRASKEVSRKGDDEGRKAITLEPIVSKQTTTFYRGHISMLLPPESFWEWELESNPDANTLRAHIAAVVVGTDLWKMQTTADKIYGQVDEQACDNEGTEDLKRFKSITLILSSAPHRGGAEHIGTGRFSDGARARAYFELQLTTDGIRHLGMIYRQQSTADNSKGRLSQLLAEEEVEIDQGLLNWMTRRPSPRAVTLYLDRIESKAEPGRTVYLAKVGDLRVGSLEAAA